jgi:hypothetical protein
MLDQRRAGIPSRRRMQRMTARTVQFLSESHRLNQQFQLKLTLLIAEHFELLQMVGGRVGIKGDDAETSECRLQKVDIPPK